MIGNLMYGHVNHESLAPNLVSAAKLGFAVAAGMEAGVERS